MTTLFDEFLERERQAIWMEQCKVTIDRNVAEIGALERQARALLNEMLLHIEAVKSSPPKPLKETI
jgi:hypothetical protein